MDIDINAGPTTSSTSKTVPETKTTATNADAESSLST